MQKICTIPILLLNPVVLSIGVLFNEVVVLAIMTGVGGVHAEKLHYPTFKLAPTIG